MANLHGGLIFIGITDQDRKIVGVPREVMAYVADVLATHLESPRWQPEMIEVPLDDGSGRCLLVLRVNPDTAPRPVFVQLTARFSKEKRNIFWVPVSDARLHQACDPDELRALFPSSGQHSRPGPCGTWRLRGSRTPRTAPTTPL
jgi:hypothetical protein